MTYMRVRKMRKIMVYLRNFYGSEKNRTSVNKNLSVFKTAKKIW